MRPPRALVAALFAGTLAAQTVHVVGPGGFATIQAAINAAANGDVVVIQSGSYVPFTLAKDLTLTAAPGAIVDILPVPFGPGISVFQPPGLAKVVGIRFRTTSFPFSSDQTQVTAGTVHFSDCAFESARNIAIAALLVQNACVAMQRCAVFGGGVQTVGLDDSTAGCDGMSAVHSVVVATDSLFFGGNLNWDYGGHGGHAVNVDDSSVHLANCIAVGGDGSALIAIGTPGDGVHIATTSRTWIADCQARGGDGHTVSGGSGLANLGSIAALTARSLFAGGGGSPSGPPTLGPLAAAPLLGLDGTTGAIVLGGTWTIRYRAAPATPVLVLWSDRLAASSPSLVSEPLWLPAGSPVADAGVTDSNGIAAFAFAIPGSPALLHAPCFAQAFAGLALPLEAAPPVGGTVR